VDTSVTASVPTYGVFTGPKGKSYVAYNPSGAAKEVTFSDGKKLKVAARSLGLKVSK
jgi:hypothetical protein